MDTSWKELEMTNTEIQQTWRTFCRFLLMGVLLQPDKLGAQNLGDFNMLSYQKHPETNVTNV
jgi:hypothetical protein